MLTESPASFSPLNYIFITTLSVNMHITYWPQIPETPPFTVQATMLKSSGQILAWCHISVTRWLEFEPELIGQPIWTSDKMSLHYSTALMSWTVDFYTARFVPHTQDSVWSGEAPRPFKVVVIDTQRALDQWLGWQIHWQARYYSSATVPQIVFQVLGVSQVTLKEFMSLVRVGPFVCHQRRGILPAEQEDRGHRDLDLVILAWECEEVKTDCQKMSHQTGINGKFRSLQICISIKAVIV